MSQRVETLHYLINYTMYGKDNILILFVHQPLNLMFNNLIIFLLKRIHSYSYKSVLEVI